MRLGLVLVLCAFAPMALGFVFNLQQQEDAIPKMVDIAWSRGPDLPQGFQDSSGGVVGDYLVTVCGFCAGHNNDKKPGKYSRGFLKKGWALNLRDAAAGWQELPEFPGEARQGGAYAVVNDALYTWGGFSYSAPFSYSDGYRLSRADGVWKWEPLPPFPWAICGASVCTEGGKIYVLGGADYDENKFYTQTDRKGENAGQGAKLLVFDTKSPDAGWKQLAQCPGTPRWVAAFAAVGGTLYLIGGATGDPYSTVVDNWSYDLTTTAWSRLPDTPIATGNFPSGRIVFRDRYLILGGGYQYAQVTNPDGTTRKPYGTVHKFQDKGDYLNDMFVYDTKTGLFGRADSMPLNNNLSMMIVNGDELYMIGGETGGATVEGQFYGHHPDLFLKGTLAVTGEKSR